MRFRILTLLICTAISLNGRPLPAQFLDAAPETPESEDAPRQDELVRQLESKAGQGGRHLAESINSLVRVGAWEQVDRWVSKYDSIADQAQLAEAAGIIGNSFLLRISLHEDVSDNARSAVNKILAAAKASKQDPTKLRDAIKDLGWDDVDAVLGANRTLTAGGEASIKELVDAIAAGISPTQRPRVIALLRALGTGGGQALGQLALYGTEAVRPNAISALAELNRTSVLDTAVTSAFATDATEAERNAASAAGLVPQGFERLDAIAVLADRLESLRRLASLAANDSAPATIWSVSEDRATVQSTASTEIYLRYREAYDAAQRMRRLGALPPKSARSALAADLAYRVMVDIDWEDATQIGQVRAAFPEASSVDQLLTSLAEQRERNDTAASLGLLRVIAEAVAASDSSQAIAAVREGQYSLLVDAVQDADPRIRYEAASIVAGLVASAGRNASFAGASYYRSTLSEMASLRSRPTAILIETRPVVALRQENILGQLGFDTRVVKSALQAEQEIRRGGDLRMVVTKIQVVDAAPAEVVDRIRRLSKGGQLPIVFYSDVETHDKSIKNAELETTSARWADENTPSVYVVPLPGNPAAFLDVLTETDSKRRLPAMSPGDRARFRLVGTAALQGDS